MKDIPANSQLQFDFLSSFSEDKSNKSWGMWNYSTYILAKNDGAFKTLSKKLPGVVNKIPNEDKLQLHVQPLLSIHLHSRVRDDLSTNTDIKIVYIISSILNSCSYCSMYKLYEFSNRPVYQKRERSRFKEGSRSNKFKSY